MSNVLLEFSKSFIKGRIDSECFSACFQELWMIERDTGISHEDDVELSEFLSTTFCLADLYNPDDDKEEYELDSVELKNEVRELFDKYER